MKIDIGTASNTSYCTDEHAPHSSHSSVVDIECEECGSLLFFKTPRDCWGVAAVLAIVRRVWNSVPAVMMGMKRGSGGCGLDCVENSIIGTGSK